MIDNGKISIRQVCVMFILVTLSPAIRLFPLISSRYGGGAGWIAPIIGSFGLIAVIAVLHAIFKGGRVSDLADAFDKSLGRKTGKVLLTIYLLWTLLLFLLYVRYYAERLASSLFTSVNLDFFIIAMMIVVFFAARLRLTALARFSEISVLVFAAIFAVFFVLLIPTFRVENVLPVTHYDAVPILRSSYPIVSVWGFITLLFFLNVENVRDMKKHARNTVLILVPATVLMLFLVIGSLGADVAMRMSLPFFRVSRLIDVMQPFDRFEAILSSVWVIADFILITVFAFVIMGISKKLFSLSEPRFLAGPIALFGYAGSMVLAANVFELEQFSNSPVPHAVNIALCIVIPAAALGVGKMRGRL